MRRALKEEEKTGGPLNKDVSTEVRFDHASELCEHGVNRS